MKPPSRIFGRRKKNQILLFGTNTQNMFDTTLKQKKNAPKTCTNYLSTSFDSLGAREGSSIVLELGEELDPCDSLPGVTCRLSYQVIQVVPYLDVLGVVHVLRKFSESDASAFG